MQKITGQEHVEWMGLTSTTKVAQLPWSRYGLLTRVAPSIVHKYPGMVAYCQACLVGFPTLVAARAHNCPDEETFRAFTGRRLPGNIREVQYRRPRNPKEARPAESPAEINGIEEFAQRVKAVIEQRDTLLSENVRLADENKKYAEQMAGVAHIIKALEV